MNNRRSEMQVETYLKLLYPAPDRQFLDSLEDELVERARELRTTHAQAASTPQSASLKGREARSFKWPVRLWPIKASRWSLAAVLILLALAAVAIAGPERVVAQVRKLLEYVPGIGFTDVSQSYALPEPVVANRNGISLEIKQVLAQPERTTVILAVNGLQSQEQSLYIYNSFLLLPNDKALTPQSWWNNLDQIVLEFGPLPAGFSAVDLVWSDDFVRDWRQHPEAAWKIPLGLKPVSGAQDDSQQKHYYPRPASATQYGVTVSVYQVSQDVSQTAIQLEYRWPANGADFTPQSDCSSRFSDPKRACQPGANRADFIGPTGVSLVDENGKTYTGKHSQDWDEFGASRPTMVIYPEDGQGETFFAYRETWIFPTLPEGAQALTLVIDKANVRLPIDEQIDFRLDIGPNPQVGDAWQLEVPIQIGDAALHIDAARVVRVQEPDKGALLALEFTLAPAPGVDISGESWWINLVSWPQTGSLFAGYSQDPKTGISILRIPLGVAGEQVMHGDIRVRGEMAQFERSGPWEITWQVPAGAQD
ncbi:MAG: hypothetical protein P8074_02715 [Anaerolineales bacterium]